jgi:hypothetical protein
MSAGAAPAIKHEAMCVFSRADLHRAVETMRVPAMRLFHSRMSAYATRRSAIWQVLMSAASVPAGNQWITVQVGAQKRIWSHLLFSNTIKEAVGVAIRFCA